jgi:uncharacterized protein YeeX (DUF496 family)
MADRDELILMVEARIKGLSQQFKPEDYEAAVDDAEEELGWSLPTTDTFKLHWLKLRARRHLISYLLAESATKFSVDQIKLNQKFTNLHDLVKQMDEDYHRAMDEYPELFADADASRIFKMVPAGFRNDWLGRDTTYK